MRVLGESEKDRLTVISRYKETEYTAICTQHLCLEHFVLSFEMSKELRSPLSIEGERSVFLRTHEVRSLIQDHKNGHTLMVAESTMQACNSVIACV